MMSEAFCGSCRMSPAFPRDETHVHVCCVGDSSQGFTVIFCPVLGFVSSGGHGGSQRMLI